MFVAVLATLVYAASAATTPVPTKSCCGPKKYQATLMEIGGSYMPSTGQTKSVDSVLELNFDYDRKMTAMIVHELDMTTGMRGNITVLNDYMNSKTYALAQDGHCYTQYLNPNLLVSPCGSDNFTINGMFTLGSAANPIKVNQVVGMYGNYNMVLTVTVDDCVLVTQALYGEDEAKTTQGIYNLLYTDVKVNMVDDSLFTIPAACSAPISLPVGKRHLEDLVGRTLPF